MLKNRSKNASSQIIVSILLILSIAFSQSFAQYQIKKYSINSGGDKLSNGRYELTSSIGQVDASTPISQDDYIINSGFLHENNNLIIKNRFE